MKLPAYVNIETRPYDSEYYRAHLNEEPIDGKLEPLAAKTKMIGVRNTIRWRWHTGPDGEPVSRRIASLSLQPDTPEQRADATLVRRLGVPPTRV